MNRYEITIINTLKNLWKITPMLLAVIGIVGLFETYITPVNKFYRLYKNFIG